MDRIGKLVVAGVGLIGGSLALALREAAAVTSIVGIGRSRVNLGEAIARGIVDRGFLFDDGAWHAELGDADIVAVATPVAQFAALFAAIAPHIGASTVVTDAGSSKQDVITAARVAFGQRFAQFVPGHPIAGSERSGTAAADPRLYVNRSVILTPTAETSARALSRIASMWQAAGARVSQLDAGVHDRIFAAVSHLPHILAHTLVDELAGRADADSLFAQAGPGFRDFTRIAASSPEMWRDVALANRDAVLAEIGAFSAALARVAQSIAAGDGAALEALFARSRDARMRWEAECVEQQPARAAPDVLTDQRGRE
ncbi:MAG: prephenate dehydrogenase/arogenate dehydrogenase family protein [Betaproteobacteria bacterium]